MCEKTHRARGISVTCQIGAHRACEFVAGTDARCTVEALNETAVPCLACIVIRSFGKHVTNLDGQQHTKSSEQRLAPGETISFRTELRFVAAVNGPTLPARQEISVELLWRSPGQDSLEPCLAFRHSFVVVG
jgi:hypothetical protein